MVGKIRVGYFLEDRGHEIILKAFVTRVAKEKGLKRGDWLDDVRAATGGKSIEAYKIFLKDISRLDKPVPFDILIIASDGNCSGYTEKKHQLLKYAENSQFSQINILVFAIPDPHIERWYLNDPEGFNQAIGSGALPVLPPYKCEKGRYKKVMRDAVVSSDVKSQFGGYEYGEKIVDAMDLCRAIKNDASLKHFIDDLKDAFTRRLAQNH
jgi:hypothetical protein